MCIRDSGKRERRNGMKPCTVETSESEREREREREGINICRININFLISYTCAVMTTERRTV